MAAPKGNSFWKLRAKHGRDLIFKTPAALWEACCEYFDAISENPLQAAELVKFQGEATVKYLPKMRAMTIDGLTIFLDISNQTWFDYGKKKDFIGVCTQVEKIIREQKFGGASAEMLNPSIIARDLGLAEKKDIEGELILKVVYDKGRNDEDGDT